MAKHSSFGHTKAGNIARMDRKEDIRESEPSFRQRMKMHNIKRWEQSAVRKPGVTRMYIENKYGSKGFNSDGTIKMSVLDKEISHAKQSGNTLWEKRLVLARTYKKQAEPIKMRA